MLAFIAIRRMLGQKGGVGMVNVDLVYFGYEWDNDSLRLEKEFIEQVSKAFPTAKLENAYDDIKGYRRSVFIEEEKEDDYLTFIFAHGWYECSMTLLLMGYNQKEKLAELFERVKREYPECIKQKE